MLHLELGFEGLTTKETYLVVDLVLGILYGEKSQNMRHAHIDNGTVRFNYRRIVLSHVPLESHSVEAAHEKVKEVLKALEKSEVRTSLSYKNIKWFLFFKNDELICYGEDSFTRAHWGSQGLVGQGYGINLLDKITVHSFSDYVKSLKERNISLKQDLNLEFPVQSKTLDGVPWVDILEQEIILKKAEYDNRLRYVVTNVGESSLLAGWLHYTNSAYVHTRLFAQNVKQDCLSYVYIKQVLDRHHSIKLLDTSKVTENRSKELSCCISLSHEVHQADRIIDTWIEVLKRRLHTFEALYARDYKRLLGKLVAGIEHTNTDLLNTVITRQLLERRQLKDTESFLVELDAQGALRGSLKLGKHWYTPFTLYRLHEYTALSTNYPELRSYIALYLYRDILESEGLTEQLYTSGFQLFRQIVENTDPLSTSALIVKVVTIATTIIELFKTHNIDLATQSLKRDPYQIRPLLKRYLAAISAIDLSLVEMESCWEEAVSQGLATTEHLVYLKSLHTWCLHKLWRRLSKAGSNNKYLPLKHQANPYKLVLTQQAITRHLPAYSLLLKLLARISKMQGPVTKVTNLTLVEQELLTTAREAVAKAMTLQEQVELYLQHNLIQHQDTAVTAHRRGFLGMLSDAIVNSLSAIHTL
jgi:hypothetical protein